MSTGWLRQAAEWFECGLMKGRQCGLGLEARDRYHFLSPSFNQIDGQGVAWLYWPDKFLYIR